MRIPLSVIVEGHGDRAAVPVLLRRMAPEIDPELTFDINVIRVSRSKIVRAEELERTIELAARKAGPNGLVLLLMDADEDCPAELGPALLARAVRARGDIPILVVLAKAEFEAWYVAAGNSLSGEAPVPDDPEALGSPKGWISEYICGGNYRETLDQPSLAARFDLKEARRAASFDYLWRRLEGFARGKMEALQLAEGLPQPQVTQG